MNEFAEFNRCFPNSMYREIHPQYKGEDKAKYQRSKAPMNKDVVSYEAVAETKNRVGWIVPKDYIVVDIDNNEDARVVFNILADRKVRFSYMKSVHGGHFIFRNDRHIPTISARQCTSIGIKVDIRCNEKGYIVLPVNDDGRSWGTITNVVDGIPFFLVPLKAVKTDVKFLGMGEGDGRNDALFSHIVSLNNLARELSVEERCESILLINRYMFKVPLSKEELDKTVLRKDIINALDKQAESKRRAAVDYEETANAVVSDHKFVCVSGDLYEYNGKYFQRFSEDELEVIIHNEYDRKLVGSQRREIINFIKIKTTVDPNSMNSAWNTVCLRNGVLNLSTMKISPHSELNKDTIYLDWNYNPNAQYSFLIDTFMNEVSGMDMAKKQLLYEMIGYCLLKKPVLSKAFLCYGDGCTGKSTFLNLITMLIQEHNVSHFSLTDLNKEFYAAGLYGKLVNNGDDIEFKSLESTALFKKLVSGERAEFNRKYKEPIAFANFATLIFTTNKLPHFGDRTDGLYRRLILIEMNHRIENPNPFFLQSITESDMEYLLMKATEAIHEALKNNSFTMAKSVKDSLEKFKDEQSIIRQFMLDNEHTRESLDYYPVMNLYREFAEYCNLCNVKRVMSKQSFEEEFCYTYKMRKRARRGKTEDDKEQRWRFVID